MLLFPFQHTSSETVWSHIFLVSSLYSFLYLLPRCFVLTFLFFRMCSNLKFRISLSSSYGDGKVFVYCHLSCSALFLRLCGDAQFYEVTIIFGFPKVIFFCSSWLTLADIYQLFFNEPTCGLGVLLKYTFVFSFRISHFIFIISSIQLKKLTIIFSHFEMDACLVLKFWGFLLL